MGGGMLVDLNMDNVLDLEIWRLARYLLTDRSFVEGYFMRKRTRTRTSKGSKHNDHKLMGLLKCVVMCLV